MKEWTAVWTNDPDDDYNLVREIAYGDIDNEVAIIKQSTQGLILKWYVNLEGLMMQIDWFLGLLQAAKEGIVDPTTIEDDIKINKWTSRWRTNSDDNHSLVLELLCEDERVATIGQNSLELLLTWHAIPKGLIVTVDWLLAQLISAKERLA